MLSNTAIQQKHGINVQRYIEIYANMCTSYACMHVHMYVTEGPGKKRISKLLVEMLCYDKLEGNVEQHVSNVCIAMVFELR